MAVGAVAVLAACGAGGAARSTGSPGPTATSGSTNGTAPPGRPVASADPGWFTYHHDAAHSGTNRATPPLLPAHQVWTSPRLDGDVYGEPLGADGLVFVATGNDTVYGLDATSGAVRWTTHLATPVPLSELPCGDVDPLGILSTPVIDPARHLLFAVTEEKLPAGVRHQLVALDTRTGSVASKRVVDPPGMNVVAQQQRSSLVIDQGRVVVAFGGLYGDCGSYHGWLVSAAEDGTGPLTSYHTPGNEVAFWSSGGPVVDADGSIFVTSGNGSSTTTYDEGEAVLRFAPALTLEDSFTVSGWAVDNASDADLGSAGPILLGGGLLFQAGKRPTGYLLDTAHLGGTGGETFAAATACASFGAEAWSPPHLYVACSSGPLRMFEVDTTGRRFTPGWTSQGPGAGPPVVAGGAVWSEEARTGILYGYDPATGRQEAALPTGPADHFATPAIVGDEIVVAARREVHAFIGPGR